MRPKAKDPEIEELRRALGLRIRDLRTQRDLTLSELAVETGVTASALSQFENGHAEPSVTTLWKLSRTLGVSVLDLPNCRDPVVEVSRADDDRPLLNLETYSYEVLTQAPSRRLDFYLLLIEPGDDRIREPITHPGEDAGYVLRGQVDVVIKDTTYTLKKGDSIWFISSQPHTFVPRGQVSSVTLWANTLTNPAAGPFAGLSIYTAEAGRAHLQFASKSEVSGLRAASSAD